MTEAEKEHVASMRQQLALAERRLEIAERALSEYAYHKSWCLCDSSNDETREHWCGLCNGWEPAENALKEMTEVKNAK